jgi:hypothetical protein
MALSKTDEHALRHWANETVAFCLANGLTPIAVLTAKALTGGMVECGCIENRFRRVQEDLLRTAAREGVESVIAQRRMLADPRTLILPEM